MQSKHRETMVLSSLSQLAHYRGDDESAREYGQQAIQLAEEAGDRNRLGTAWMMLGYALLRMGQLGESAEAFQQTVHLRRELNQPNLMMESLAGLARVALEQKDLAKALEITEDILELLEMGSLDGTTDPFQVPGDGFPGRDNGSLPGLLDVLRRPAGE
jgi:tetratricopeptide (TPR) repeat protein